MLTTGISHPRDSDVLFGRGKAFQNHVGNKMLHLAVDQRLKAYFLASLKGKNDIIDEVTRLIRDDRGGRFLRRDDDDGRSTSGLWYEVDPEEARKKVGHTIRSRMRSQNVHEKIVEQHKLARATAALRNKSVVSSATASLIGGVGSLHGSITEPAAMSTTNSTMVSSTATPSIVAPQPPVLQVMAAREQQLRTELERQIEIERLNCERQILSIKIGRHLRQRSSMESLTSMIPLTLKSTSPQAFGGGIQGNINANAPANLNVPSAFLNEQIMELSANMGQPRPEPNITDDSSVLLARAHAELCLRLLGHQSTL